MKNFRFVKAVKIMLFVALGITFFAYVVMRLWNWLLPDILGISTITFLQAAGLLVLSRLLFGGFHRCGGHHRHNGPWRRKLKEKYGKMSPDEKEKFRQKFSKYCMHTKLDFGDEVEQQEDVT